VVASADLLLTPADAACGGTWVSSLLATDPVRAVPSYMGVVVSSRVARSGGTLAGDVAHVVVVRTDPGYAGRPATPGTGTIVATLC
jgi:hypothetical protein